MPDSSRSVVMVLEAKFPAYGGGGAESQVLTLGGCLVDRDVRIQVVVPRVADGPQAERELVERLDVVRIAYPKIRLLGGMIMLVKLAWFLFAQRKHYQVIHAHIAHNMAAVATLMGNLLSKPVVVKLTGMRELVGGILDPNPGWPARIRKFAIQRATLIQATSERIRQTLIDRGFAASQVLVLPNGVDVERFSTSVRDDAFRRELCGDTSVVGVFVGRLAPEKNHELLLRAWAAKLADHHEAKLVLVGDGVMRQSLIELSEQLGISRQIVFAGHSSDVGRYLAIADFGLLTSMAEGLSNSLLEYMAAGLPVIGSRISGTEDFVKPGSTGWLFEPGDGNALAQALGHAVSAGPEQLRAMGEQARQLIMSTASLEAVTNQLMKCYGFVAKD
jgi:glycosyltransferase involved in cell wall biosynthesis